MAPALSPLLEGNTADFGFAPAGTNALLARFVEGGLITVSRRRECEAELKQMQDVDELWTICVRMPPPGWRLIGRFMDKDCFAILHAVHRAKLEAPMGAAAFQTALEGWDKAFPGLQPRRSAKLGDYLTGQYNDLDDEDT